MVGRRSRRQALNSALWESPSTRRNNRAIILSWLPSLDDFLRVSTIRRTSKQKLDEALGQWEDIKILRSHSVHPHLKLNGSFLNYSRFLHQVPSKSIWKFSVARWKSATTSIKQNLSDEGTKVTERAKVHAFFLLPTTFQKQCSFILVQRRISTSAGIKY